MIARQEQGIIPHIVDNLLLLFGFLSIFHVISAVVLAGAVRAFWRGLHQGQFHGCRLVFTAVWAAAFGGIPLIFGIGVSRGEYGIPWFTLAQVALWAATFLVVLLAEDALKSVLEPLRDEGISLMLFGGLFLLTGLAVMVFVRENGRAGAILPGGLFAIVGAGIFAAGLWKMLHATR
ncbi:MAG: hypothetical protein ACOC7Y_02280 [Chloroflexota bacterium]